MSKIEELLNKIVEVSKKEDLLDEEVVFISTSDEGSPRSLIEQAVGMMTTDYALLAYDYKNKSFTRVGFKNYGSLVNRKRAMKADGLLVVTLTKAMMEFNEGFCRARQVTASDEATKMEKILKGETE